MKFIYITDVHLKGKNPSSRIDVYIDSAFNKLTEVYTVAKDSQLDFVLIGGDLFDTSQVALSVIDRLCDLIEHFNIKTYVLWGNHDENNCNKGGTALEHCFNRCKLMHPLTLIEDDKFILQGIEYTISIDQDLKNNGYTFNSDKFKILAPHANITPSKCVDGFSHVVAKELKTDADLVLVSHYHAHHGIKKINNTEFAWVGALTRGTIGVGDINRIPSYLIFDNGKSEIIELKCALPASEVFDLDKVDAIKATKNDLNGFIASLKESRVNSFKFIDRLNYYCDENKVDKLIKDVIINNMIISEDE